MRPITFAAAILAVSCAALNAQSPFTPEASEMHVSSEMDSAAAISSMLAPVTGQPYSATKTTHSVWKLNDGTTIRHDSSAQIARDGEGRVREDILHTVSSSIGGNQHNQTRGAVTVTDPVDHTLTSWQETGSKIAVRMQMPDFSALHPHSKLAASLAEAPPPPPSPPRLGGMMGGTMPSIHPVALGTKNQIHTEELGQQSIAGVLATGKRTTTVIPTDEIGNDQPITIVHEEWYSPELKVVVKSIDSDPRSGDRTMELEGLTRGEPDTALFHPPADYNVKEMGALLNSFGGAGKTTPKAN